ncbi:MFS transporter [Amnibacterium flavum]
MYIRLVSLARASYSSSASKERPVAIADTPPGSIPAEHLFEPARVPKRILAAFLGAYLGSYLIILIPVITTLAIKVAEVAPDSREATLGVITGIGALVAVLANPIFGMLSDRTTSRFGMRRPWILGGATASVLSLIALAFAPDALAVGALWCVVQLSCNAMFAGLAAFLPDRVPEAQRATVSALSGIVQQFSPLIGLAVANLALSFGTGTPGMFIVPATLGLILIVVYVIVARDRVLSPNLRSSFRVSDLAKAFAFNPRRNPDFGWAWLGRFFMQLGFAAGATYQVYFLNARFGIPFSAVAGLQLGLSLLSVIMITIAASVSGTLSDKLHRRKIFVFAASGLVAVSSLLTAFALDMWVYFVAAAILGIATGAYFAVDLALVTDVLPNKQTQAAKDMGVFNIASALPQSLAPALAPLVLAIGGGTENYAALYIGAGIVAVLGALTVIPIKAVR